MDAQIIGLLSQNPYVWEVVTNRGVVYHVEKMYTPGPYRYGQRVQFPVEEAKKIGKNDVENSWVRENL